MQAFTAPLKHLHQKAAWFMRAHELRLLHVRCDASLQRSVLKLLQDLEWHADNFSPLSTLEAPFKASAHGWDARLEALDALHRQRQDLLAREGLSLPPLPDRERDTDPLLAFISRGAQLASLHCPPLAGHLMLLAPPLVEDENAWQAALLRLLMAPTLKEVRWMVLRVESPSPALLLEALQDRALEVVCTVDPQMLRQESGRVLETLAAAASGSVPASTVGGTWPVGVRPPPRRPPGAALEPDQAGAAPAGSSPIHAAEGPPPAHAAVGAPPALAASPMLVALTRAIRAQQEGLPLEAIRAQEEAVEEASRAGLHREALLLQLTLAGYQVQADQRDVALRTFDQVGVRAREEGCSDLESQAGFGAGALELGQQHFLSAARHFEAAAKAAEAASIPPLAVEALRLAGQAWLEGGKETAAKASWERALELSDHEVPSVVQATGVREVGRALAVLLRDQGREQEARAVDAHLERLIVAGGSNLPSDPDPGPGLVPVSA